MVSSKGTTLPPPPPLRTGQISFPLSGSSLSQHPCDGVRPTPRTRGMMDLIVTSWVEQHPIVYGRTAPVRAPDLVLVVPSCGRGDREATVRAAPMLACPERENGVPALEGGCHRAAQALFEVQLPLWVVGIHLALNLGMPGDGEPVGREEADDLGVPLWA